MAYEHKCACYDLPHVRILTFQSSPPYHFYANKLSGQTEGERGVTAFPLRFSRGNAVPLARHVTQKVNDTERCEILKNRQALQVCRVSRSKIVFSFRGEAPLTS